MKLRNLVIAASLAALGSAAYAQTEKVKQLDVEEIKKLIVDKSITFQSRTEGRCNFQFKNSGYAFGVCDRGTGSGKYKIGFLTTKGEERTTADAEAKPRYCIDFVQFGFNCSIIYMRSDGSYWISANKIKIEVE